MKGWPNQKDVIEKRTSSGYVHLYDKKTMKMVCYLDPVEYAYWLEGHQCLPSTYMAVWAWRTFLIFGTIGAVLYVLSRIL